MTVSKSHVSRPTLYLVGFPASGKTTAGKWLHKSDNRLWFDLDREIETTAGLSIPQIFDRFGESHFRKLEAESLKNNFLQNAIISTGGGTPLFHGNMEFMLSSGIVIYLKLPVEDLIARLMKSKTKRPLFENLTQEQMQEKIQEMYRFRDPVYSKAHIHFSAKNLKSGNINSLKSLIDNYLKKNNRET